MKLQINESEEFRNFRCFSPLLINKTRELPEVLRFVKAANFSYLAPPLNRAKQFHKRQVINLDSRGIALESLFGFVNSGGNSGKVMNRLAIHRVTN